MQVEEKIYQIALSQIKGVGYALSRKLMTQFGSAQAIFCSTWRELTKASGGSQWLAQAVLSGNAVAKAAALLASHAKANTRVITPWEETYPERLRHLYGAPTLLYLQGDANLNQVRVLSIVGTRNATNYGKRVVEKLLGGLSAYPLLLVSGLAYGVDIHAHRTALEIGMPTLAVLAGGTDVIYPVVHTKVTASMLAQGGGLLSEHALRTKPEKHQFATRNRIIAGLADATIVVEAGQKSGALITAKYANDYNREVFAVPGDIDEASSVGCHHLIQTHQANLLTTAADIVDLMQWDEAVPATTNILDVLDRLPTLTEREQEAVRTMSKLNREVHIDELSYQTQIPLNQLSAILLQLELKRIIKVLPGKKFKLSVY